MTLTVLELRRYTLHPGRRDELIDLFDREFVETQEAVGITVVGQFRDRDRPDQFVWIRGFRDMPARAEALSAFYEGPVWRKYRDAANATMVDSDDVLLFRPVSGFELAGLVRPRDTVPAVSVVAASTYHSAEPLDVFVPFILEEVQPLQVDAGATVLATLRTEPAPNTFPALPVRTGENAVVCFAWYRDLAAYQQSMRRLADSVRWHDEVFPELTKRLASPVHDAVLTPTGRSLLR